MGGWPVAWQVVTTKAPATYVAPAALLLRILVLLGVTTVMQIFSEGQRLIVFVLKLMHNLEPMELVFSSNYPCPQNNCILMLNT